MGLSADPSPASVRAQPPLLRLRYMVLAGMLIAILLPMGINYLATGIPATRPAQYNTALGSCVALILGVLGYRRLHIFPGIAAGGYIVISLSVTFGALAIAFLLMRIDYSRAQFLGSYLLSLCVYLFIHQKVAIHRRLQLGVVPSAATLNLPRFPSVDWIMLDCRQQDSTPSVDAIIADLHTNHDDAWDKQITRFVLSGVPVYHFKQAIEQMSGRVEIHHLSENTLGSLNPNDVYLKAKGVFDTILAALLLILLSPVILIIGFVVILDSPGPALFRQQRVGYRGVPFTAYKIRTMRVEPLQAMSSDQEACQASLTQKDDPRITRFGSFLRRTRLDELPQLINIVRGEMSLIGPRPVTIPISKWYEKEVPFFHYRHLIKPGITGWAQINQGYGGNDIDSGREKVSLDFYYVKNFSLWLDLLIAVRTARTMISGHGAH
jgi:lipopolysaccharide/colanic/teichoic acid biosynthesis glycosyltransferase